MQKKHWLIQLIHRFQWLSLWVVSAWCALVFSAQGQRLLDHLGNQYLERQDQYWQEIAESSTLTSWQQFDKLGEISRHHRYATLKTQLWFELLHQETVDPEFAQSGLVDWMDKNKRHLKMRTALRQYLQTSVNCDQVDCKKMQKLSQPLVEFNPQTQSIEHYFSQ